MKAISCVLVLACFLCVVALARAQQESHIPSDGDANANQGGGLINMLILSPIKRTINHAKRILGLERVTNGIDNVRLKTYQMFMRVYNKTYSNDEIPRRMARFFERRKEIEDSIKSFQEGRSLFSMRENEFVDWSDDEIKKLTGVSLPNLEEMTAEELGNSNTTTTTTTTQASGIADNEIDVDESIMSVKADSRQIPALKDWRTSGCVSTPINQLKCGACYAIATMSVVESMRCINKVSSPILSPQQVVDCASVRAGYQNYGCDGGWPTRVLKYLQDVQIAARESCYPFVRRQNYCKLRQVQSTPGCTVSASPKDSGKIQYKVLNNERDILYHVAKTGPVATVVKASDKFLYYGAGIFDDPICSRRRDDVDHAIVIVGYGRENNVDYWIIKNSWGTTTWGQGGYGLYKRGTNACSIGHWGWVIVG